MCGIFGIAYCDASRRVDERMVAESTDLMAHRGPDDGGYWAGGNVGLGHRRLSIIDLSPSGHQPMFNQSGSIALVYNGEIYNFPQIRAELIERGHAFKSRSDTEVIIHAYEEWGFDCLHRFNGMFAFAIWDSRSSTLWLVRDRLGVKPLYYYFDGKVLLFSSEVKPLLATGLVRAELNPEVIDAYLSVGYVPAPQTMFKGICKLRPGHFLTLRDGGLVEKEYWDFASVEASEWGAAESLQRLEALLLDSVSKRLISDVPVGVFLSGGLDSSLVVSLVSGLSEASVNTYTVGYDSGLSEAGYAELVAGRLGTRHRMFKLRPEDFFSSLATMVGFCEEPVVEPAAIALYHISRLARETATVLLSGEGSDELFAGYYLYHLMAQIERAQGLLPRALPQALARIAHPYCKLKHLKYLDWLSTPLQKSYQGTSSYLTESVKKKLYAPELLAGKGRYLEETFSYHFDRVKHMPDSVNKMLYVDTKTWLVDDLLLKADKMTMAASVELRVPFLDYRLVEFAMSLPSSLKLQNGCGKRILKNLARQRVPDEIVDRKKMGFPVPIDEWFGAGLFPAISDRIAKSDLLSFLNPRSVQRLLSRHQSGAEENGKLIMSLLVLDVWKETFLAGAHQGGVSP